MASCVRSPLGELSNRQRDVVKADKGSEPPAEESESFSDAEDAYLTEEEELELDMVCRNEMLSLGEEIPAAEGEEVLVQVDLPTRSRRKATRTFTTGNHVEDVAFWAISELAASVSEEEVLQGEFRDERETWRLAGWELISRALRASFSVLLEETLLDVGLSGSVSLRLQHSVQPTSLSRDSLFPVDEEAVEQEEESLEDMQEEDVANEVESVVEDESLADADITENILQVIQQSMQEMNIIGESSASMEVPADDQEAAQELDQITSSDTEAKAEAEVRAEAAGEDSALEEYDTLNDEDSLIEDLAGLCISSPVEEYAGSDEEDVDGMTALLENATLERKPEDDHKTKEDSEVMAHPVFESQSDVEDSDDDHPLTVTRPEGFLRRRVIIDSEESDESDNEVLPARSSSPTPAEELPCNSPIDASNTSAIESEAAAMEFSSDEEEDIGLAIDIEEESFYSASGGETAADEEEGEFESFYDANSFLDDEPLEIIPDEDEDTPTGLSVDLDISSVDLCSADDGDEGAEGAAEKGKEAEEAEDTEWSISVPSPLQPSDTVDTSRELPSPPVGPPVTILREEPKHDEEEAPKVPWMRRVIESDSESDGDVEIITGVQPSSPSVEEVIVVEEDEQSEDGERDLAKALTSTWNHCDDVLVDHCGEDGSVPNLLVKLHKHQRIGVNWMVTRELETHKDITEFGAAARGGGILADDMGLGKTIQTLGLVLCNPSPVQWKGTLIVCTLSTVKQWEEEVANRVKPGHLKVCLYYGPRRTKDPYELLNADVVLTTYGIMSSEYAQAESGVELIDPEGSPAPVKKRGKGKKAASGCLYKIHWWRVVLDEAHAIKNRSTKKHKAACAIPATHHWCLTGTPIENSPFDLYSLLHFAQAPQCHNVRYFKSLLQDVKNTNSPWAFEKLKSLIQPSLLRRKKAVKNIAGASNANGKNDAGGGPRSPGVVSLPPLPPCTVHNEIIPFSNKDEQAIYEALWNNAQQKFEAMQKKGTVLKNVMTILELILRCRQACVHPYLLIDVAEQPASLPLEISARVTAVEETDYALANRRVKVMAHQLLAQEAAAAQGLELSQLAQVCAICLSAVEDPILLKPCQHSFCRECVRSAPGPMRKCAQCGAPVMQALDAPKRKRRVSVEPSLLAPKEVAAEKLVLGDLPDECLAHVFSFLDFGDLWSLSSVSKRLYHVVDSLLGAPLGSTKVDALVTRLQEGPPCKSIVFSQFSTVLNVIQHRLYREGIPAARLDGSMPLKKRASEIERFKTDPSAAVFLISLKAGCCGLNLSEATQVFLMDPWWNPQVEQQAIDRVHRMGQKKPVSVWRYIVHGTLEQQILRLQDKKRDLSEAFLGQKSSLSAQDISELFAFAPITNKQQT